MITAEQVGGEVSRTIRLDIGTGRFSVKTAGEEIEL
jgi:chemotaxis receptor (MCP) glutamine deamidase CheD